MKRATTAQIHRAQDTHCLGTNDIEVDSNAEVSESDEGVWVSAWVWIGKDEEKNDG